jgi:hypothetical protein
MAETLKDLARAALEQADGDTNEACRLLRKLVESDPALWEQHVDPIISVAIREVVENCMRSTRSAYWNPQPSGETLASPETRAGIMLVGRDLLMNYPLRNGKKLGDCTIAEILAEVPFYRRQGLQMLRVARWLELVAARRPRNVLVRSALTEEKLRDYQTKAIEEIEEMA